MPALPSPPPFSPAFNAAQIIGLAVFIVVVVVMCGLYLVALHIGDKVAERRARVMDIEAASKPSSIAVHEQSHVMSTKQKAAAAVLVAARAKLPVKAKGIAPVPVVSLTGSKLVLKMTHLGPNPVSVRFGSREARVRPGPSPLRTVVFFASPLPAPVSAHIFPVSPSLAQTLAQFVFKAYQLHDSDSEDSDDDTSHELFDFDGLRMVRPSEHSWMPVRAGTRRPTPAILGASKTANRSRDQEISLDSFKRTSVVNTKRSPFVNKRANKENGVATIQPLPRALFAQ
ncbi:hypothetical protein B0H17DRAFT_1209845 [Mycena rosella]|uniref:Transmembrane protein n=1 Tax=Mycena rosella TaxID=1033263 RepID=A0AAD7CYR1_MYCRO|nr:hypothetical protein B0H17DRAFT_1209845 [Mycena rosella]